LLLQGQTSSGLEKKAELPRVHDRIVTVTVIEERVHALGLP
jgi:hypothetical protein